WKKANFLPEASHDWKVSGFTFETSQKWRGLAFSPSDAQQWNSKGFDNPQLATNWKSAGFTPDTASEWANPSQLNQNIDEESQDSESAMGSHPNGFPPQEAAQWVLNKFEVQEAIAWRASGENNPSEAQLWKQSGLGPQQFSLWGRLGLNPTEALDFGKAGIDPD